MSGTTDTAMNQALAQQREGYDEAMENFRTTLRCPPCAAKHFLDNTERGLLGYTGGYRLAAHEVRCLWPHECEAAGEEE